MRGGAVHENERQQSGDQHAAASQAAGEDGREGDARDGVRRATYDDARPFGETGDSGGETEGAGGAGGSRGELEKRERRRTRDAGSERVGGVWK